MCFDVFFRKIVSSCFCFEPFILHAPQTWTKLKNLIKKGKTEKKQTKGRGENDENGGAL